MKTLDNANVYYYLSFFCTEAFRFGSLTTNLAPVSDIYHTQNEVLMFLLKSLGPIWFQKRQWLYYWTVVVANIVFFWKKSGILRYTVTMLAPCFRALSTWKLRNKLANKQITYRQKKITVPFARYPYIS